MAREPKPGPARAGQKRPWGTAISCNYGLDYELYREDVPHRVCDYQRIPPLINRAPTKVHVGLGVKRSVSPHKAPRTSQLPAGQIKLQMEKLHSIRGELGQIKAQVDRLLETVERMDQQRDQLPGTEDCEQNGDSRSKGSSCRTAEPPQEPTSQRTHPEADSPQNADLEDLEETVKNHASGQEGSQ